MSATRARKDTKRRRLIVPGEEHSGLTSTRTIGESQGLRNDDERPRGFHNDEVIGDDILDDSEDIYVKDEPDRPVAFRPHLERAEDGYVAGSVVRIKLHNFMTYDFVEFQPGPYLNMILGPNGTGKSTIAAAIAIGLGFAPKIMGRAHDLKSYVKQGAENAETEIELKSKHSGSNQTIWRKFSREDDKSEWRLNGELVSKRRINDLVASFGVQANNLCSFLPQDKVAEFAKMQPVTVLKETMRAAGDPRLTKWHEHLIENGHLLKELEASISGNIQKRDTLQHQVNELEPDVRNYEARKDQEMEREILDHLVIAAEFHECKKKMTEAQSEMVDKKAKMKSLKRKQRPLKDLIDFQELKFQKAETSLQVCDDNLKDQNSSQGQTIRELIALDKAGDEVERKLLDLDKNTKRLEAEKLRLRTRIAECQAVLDMPNDGARERLNEKLREKKESTLRIRAAQSQTDTLKETRQDMERTADSIRNDIRARVKRLDDLSNIDIQRKNRAFQFDPSIQFATEWIEKNQMSFESKVHLPPMISANVSNKLYAWQIEACTSVAQRKTFICQNENDYRRMLALNGTQFQSKPGVFSKVALHLAVVVVTDEEANPPRPCSQETLRDLGFEGFAIDFVEAETPVMTFLCQAAKLHQAAITQLPSTSIDTDRVIRNGIPQWHTRNDSNRSTRSLYGSRAFQISTFPAVPARAFHLSVDTEAIKTIEDEAANLKRRLKDMEQPLNQIKIDYEQSAAKVKDAVAADEELRADIDRLSTETNRHKKALHEIEMCSRKLADLESQPSSVSQRKKFHDDLVSNARDRVPLLANYQDACESSLKAVATLAQSTMTSIQVGTNLETITGAFKIREDKMNDLSDEFHDAEKDHINQKKMASVALEKLKTRLKAQRTVAVAEAVKRRFKEDITVAGIKRQLADIDAEMELSVGVNVNTVNRYERLTNELRASKATVEQQEKELVSLNSKIKNILTRFSPALDELIKLVNQKFSAAFERIGCSGEVRIRRVEGDFASWGIEILVSYRDNERLAVLTASRQSGGERSLATVTYLMSLSEVARTPFSLVDEINQGMDQRAERNVHNQMVEVTCSEQAGQSFLITPKLLTDLNYHPKMKVLVVNNGTWIPDSNIKSQNFGSLSSCLNMFRQSHGVSAA